AAVYGWRSTRPRDPGRTPSLNEWSAARLPGGRRPGILQQRRGAGNHWKKAPKRARPRLEATGAGRVRRRGSGRRGRHGAGGRGALGPALTREPGLGRDDPLLDPGIAVLEQGAAHLVSGRVVVAAEGGEQHLHAAAAVAAEEVGELDRRGLVAGPAITL